MGRSFSSRVAASLLHSVGLPELITHSQEEFERKAIEMALSAATLLETKKKLARNRHTTTLFDGKIFARHMEAGYKKMHERHQKGLTPEAIEVFCSHLD
jgi:predicted O-linked N-acetylglucosamine transferase (SPINDLY family)